MNSDRLLSKDIGNEKHTNSEEALLNKNFLVSRHQFQTSHVVVTPAPGGADYSIQRDIVVRGHKKPPTNSRHGDAMSKVNAQQYQMIIRQHT